MYKEPNSHGESSERCMEHKGKQRDNKESLFYDYLVMVFQSLIGITNN